MNPLWDSATVKELARSVRQTSPDDWKASRQRARSLKECIGIIAISAFMILLAAISICLPYLAKTETDIPPMAASGLAALNFLGLGLFTGYWLCTHTFPALTPLINTPARGYQVYLYLLHEMRRQTAWKGLAILCGGLITPIILRLITWHILTAEALLQALAAGLALTASSVAFGVVVFLGITSPWWLRKLFYNTFILLFLSELLGLSEKMPIPLSIWLGDFFTFLPQAQICQWLTSGGPWPMPELLGCAIGIPLVLLLILHALREQNLTFSEDTQEEAEEWRAESFAAATVRQWQQSSRDTVLDDAVGDEDLTEGRDSTEETWPLLAHPSAPSEHSVPVSAQFRETMASHLRELLLSTGKNCALESCISPHTPEALRMRTAWRWGWRASVLFPLLAEATAWLPPGLGQVFSPWFIVAGLLLIAISMISSLASIPRTLPLVGSQWVRLPMDPAVHAASFFRWQRQLLLRRCLLVLGLLGGMTLTGLALVALRSLLPMPMDSPVTLERLLQGHLSLLFLAVVLFTTVQVIRHVEALNFYRQMFAFIRWRGLWSKLSWLYGLIFIAAEMAIFSALAALLFLTLYGVSYGFPWLFILLNLLGSEILHLTNRWLALQVARWGRGDWMTDS